MRVVTHILNYIALYGIMVNGDTLGSCLHTTPTTSVVQTIALQHLLVSKYMYVIRLYRIYSMLSWATYYRLLCQIRSNSLMVVS